MDKQFGTWRKSTRSGPDDHCVEVATSTDRYIGVRDSKNREGGVLVFSSDAWADFVEGVRRGEFDL